MAHGRIKYVPRWLYQSIVLPPGNTEDVEPTIFVNDTIWDWRLENLVFYVPLAPGFFTSTGTQIDIRLGMSGQSDLNLVQAPVGIVGGNINKRHLQAQANGVYMYWHKLKHVYRLSKDDGFVVRARISSADYGSPTEPVTLDTSDRPMFVAKGRRVHSNEPVVLVGRADAMVDPGEQQIYETDLFNDGFEDVDIHTIGFQETVEQTRRATSYQVNPITGVNWMPGEIELPMPLLSPYGQDMVGGLAANTTSTNIPIAVEFDEKVVLRRRQHIRIRLQNNDATNNKAVLMALFGYLEVK